MRLYHYACSHSAAAIEREQKVKPMLSWGALDYVLRQEGLPESGLVNAPPIVWLTDMTAADDVMALGLTSDTISCDRTEYRYEVDVPEIKWDTFALLNGANRAWRNVLESHGKPEHWFVALEPATVLGVQIKGHVAQ